MQSTAPLHANWSYPTAIRFGAGRISELAEACQVAGILRPLFVTDPGVRDLPIAARAVQVLEQAGLPVTVFSDVQPNPTAGNVEAGLAEMRHGEHDGVVAFGGGSALDTGKVIAFMLGQSRPIWDFEDVGDWWMRADPTRIAPIVAVPTTAGTGSEVGRAGVITNEAEHVKKIIFHPKMLPHTVICDAELTLDLPATITAGTGFDAFVHCLEAYCTPSYHPMSAGIAVEGIRLVWEFLPRAYRNGQDLEARAHMMSAAAMGAVAFQKGLGGIHALSHPVSALYGTPHGLTNALFTPYMLRANRPAIETRITRLAAWLGIEPGFDAFFHHVLELRDILGIPDTLAELGVSDPDLKRLAAMAVTDPTAASNPVPMDASGARTILHSATLGTAQWR